MSSWYFPLYPLQGSACETSAQMLSASFERRLPAKWRLQAGPMAGSTAIFRFLRPLDSWSWLSRLKPTRAREAYPKSFGCPNFLQNDKTVSPSVASSYCRRFGKRHRRSSLSSSCKPECPVFSGGWIVVCCMLKQPSGSVSGLRLSALRVPPDGWNRSSQTRSNWA